MKKRQSQYSKEFVEAIVFADADPTGNAVSFEFPVEDEAPTGTTATGQWKPSSWDGQKATAQCLVGPPDGELLDPGTYDVYVEWSEAPEEPLILAGQLEIY